MQVIITPKAQKQYNQLPKPEQKKIKKKLINLETNPLSGKKLSGELSQLHSLRAWPYRIIYYISNSKNSLYIVSIHHRQGAYK